jgi:hypothetical protein
MPYPWPTSDPVLQEALDIALDYLEFTGQATPFIQTQWLCANAILAAWNDGERHRVKLANCAILAIESEKGRLRSMPSVYPQVD